MMGSPQPTESVYYDRMSFSSAASRNGPGGGAGNSSWEKEKEDLKRDYEFQIATLTSKLSTLLSTHSSHADSVTRQTQLRESAERDAELGKEQVVRAKEELKRAGRELEEVRTELERERERVWTLEEERKERELAWEKEREEWEAKMEEKVQ